MAYDRQLEHWQKTLEGAPALTEAPTDRARPPKVESSHCANVKQHIPPALLDTIRERVTDAKIKGFCVAAWQVCAEVLIAPYCNSISHHSFRALALSCLASPGIAC
jgi:hypothetical protein